MSSRSSAALAQIKPHASATQPHLHIILIIVIVAFAAAVTISTRFAIAAAMITTSLTSVTHGVSNTLCYGTVVTRKSLMANNVRALGRLAHRLHTASTPISLTRVVASAAGVAVRGGAVAASTAVVGVAVQLFAAAVVAVGPSVRVV